MCVFPRRGEGQTEDIWNIPGNAEGAGRYIVLHAEEAGYVRSAGFRRELEGIQ